MANSVKASESKTHPDAELPTLMSTEDIRRNPRLALVFKLIAWTFGLVAVSFPILITKIYQTNVMPEWGGAALTGLIALVVVTGIYSSYYNKSPREIQFQAELRQAKKNLETASGLISRLSEQINDRIALFETVKRKVEDQKRVEKELTSEGTLSVARIVVDELSQGKRREERRRLLRDMLLLVAGFALGVVGNWVASPLLAWIF
ncbi:hypothetical protein JOF56_004170 [Kibdelosporangium banguiense]|uniref:Uncharacterized protein n=1 Tax=Kibdelosporangium banguiense TaxID=1365924 RepID=A0ABS4TH75_9PSEU|nr:hypothetical protein [Kibdelosporangium banguiense]MBP2323785.1 hypothetical protein [Kibdelosporangium banguiense]